MAFTAANLLILNSTRVLNRTTVQIDALSNEFAPYRGEPLFVRVAGGYTVTALAVLLGVLLYLYTVSLHYTTILFYYTYILQVTEQLPPRRRLWTKRG